ncbi:hypothetical protein BV898_14045 [Hypsibius exemplaris]|uniref:HAT C-terminal dimerisation domain-containing protein n=1 Tax=Hypsibius exemplaris TaxID=2072580 RepID=A0A1W0W8Y8_HYPEX|nr:hypothetical protein BV898_14045 [Hypsibius exemplaris]
MSTQSVQIVLDSDEESTTSSTAPQNNGPHPKAFFEEPRFYKDRTSLKEADLPRNPRKSRPTLDSLVVKTKPKKYKATHPKQKQFEANFTKALSKTMVSVNTICHASSRKLAEGIDPEIIVVLCATATTAGVERVFSLAGFLLSDRRLRTGDGSLLFKEGKIFPPGSVIPNGRQDFNLEHRKMLKERLQFKVNRTRK